MSQQRPFVSPARAVVTMALHAENIASRVRTRSNPGRELKACAPPARNSARAPSRRQRHVSRAPVLVRATPEDVSGREKRTLANASVSRVSELRWSHSVGSPVLLMLLQDQTNDALTGGKSIDAAGAGRSWNSPGWCVQGAAADLSAARLFTGLWERCCPCRAPYAMQAHATEPPVVRQGGKSAAQRTLYAAAQQNSPHTLYAGPLCTRSALLAEHPSG